MKTRKAKMFFIFRIFLNFFCFVLRSLWKRIFWSRLWNQEQMNKLFYRSRRTICAFKFQAKHVPIKTVNVNKQPFWNMLGRVYLLKVTNYLYIFRILSPISLLLLPASTMAFWILHFFRFKMPPLSESLTISTEIKIL